MSLRILFTPHAYSPVRGGTELLCERVAEWLTSQGHEVRVLTTNVGAVDGYYRFGFPRVAARAERRNGVDIVRVSFGGWLYAAMPTVLAGLPFAGLRGRVESRAMQWMRWRLRRDLRRGIRAFEPHVVVAMPHLVVNVQAVLKIRERDAFPLVLLPLLHEEDVHWNMASMADAIRRADAVVAITNVERERLIAAYHSLPEATFLGGMGVEPAATVVSHQQTPPSVVFLGRMTAGKGVGLLVRAMAQVWETHPHVGLVLAGARSANSPEVAGVVDALPAALRRRVAVEFDISEARKRHILERACCLVLPSAIESFGGVILEAWAHGVPVVTWDLPVFREIVRDGVDGLLAAPKDTEAMARAIRQLLDNPQGAMAMGRSGSERARETFNWASVAARHLEAYEHAIAAFRKRGAFSASPSTTSDAFLSNRAS